jgi:hypothetical protein
MTILRTPLVRSQPGYDLKLDGYQTEHIAFGSEVLYRNLFLGVRLMDEEIAFATMPCATGACACGEGTPAYPGAYGCPDHLIAKAVHEAASTATRVVTSVEAWSTSP